MAFRDLWHSSLLWVYERGKTLDRNVRRRNESYSGQREVGGVALPPSPLRVRVTGTADIFSFLDGGEKAAATVRNLLSRQGVEVAGLGSILDFGCGCGRVLRHWRGLKRTAVHGCDTNADLVRWCQAHLADAEVRVNAREPPLEYGTGQFDVIYAFSVFTHLPAAAQQAWLAEFRRILRPSGHLIFSSHGSHYQDRLSPAEEARFDRGELVVRHVWASGTNYCNTFHPECWVRKVLLDGWEVLDFVPCGALGNPMQDAWVVRPKVC
jgi:2-polyprenyl-3-methyl-5-hydroxy-6-metoxy-1,4-benzoquinol methylase